MPSLSYIQMSLVNIYIVFLPDTYKHYLLTLLINYSFNIEYV